MKLHLGVTDIPYDYGDTAATTHEVAALLEEKYQLFTHFYQLHEREILAELSQVIAEQVDNSIRFGAPMADHLELSGASQLFSDFLNLREMEGLGVEGVPTGAAVKGVNSRKKGKKGIPGRPSFIDGGLLLSSLRVWVDLNG